MNPQRHTLMFVGIATCLILSTIIAGCAPVATPAPAAPTAAPAATTAPAAPVATTAPAAPAATSAPAAPAATAGPTAASAPTTLNIAAIYETESEQPYDTSFIQAIDRLKKSNKHNLTINLDATENVQPPDAERVLQQYAATGKYQIIWAHSSYIDAVQPLAQQYPDIAWVVTGSGNKAPGGNVFWVDTFDQEPSYLAGLIAGKMTKSNIIGAVASYPYANVNDPVNAFIAGAQSVNPKVQARVSFIQSWWDPAKAKESALAQIADGADYIFAERFGPFDACDQKSVYCFGYFADQNSMSPSVVASAIANWDPDVELVIDAWWNHVTQGTPYNAATQDVAFSMKDGGSSFALSPNYASKLPQDVVDLVNKDQAAIMAGTLQVPANAEAPTAGELSGAMPEPTAAFTATTAMTSTTAVTSTTAMTTTAAVTSTTAMSPTVAAPANAPTTLNIAAIFITPVEEPWNTSWLQTIDRLKKSNGHNLTINLDYTENVQPPDAERVLRQYAQTGKYQIIWAHSSFIDAVKAAAPDYPDIAWVVTGSGNAAPGGNIFWADVYDHEPAYIAGIVAGKMTKTNLISAVGAYPYANVNLPINAFFAGAKSVNPNIKTDVTFIASWWDPAKAKESALAQIAAGSDYIFAERYGPFDACTEKSVSCIGYFVDQNSMAPSVIPISVVALWDPDTNFVINAWWNHATTGAAYNAPTKPIIYSMKDGGGDISLNPAFNLPQDVKDAVVKARSDILSGALAVPYNDQAPAQ